MYMSPQGRFLQRDPAGFVGPGANLYEYVMGNPVNYVDPNGLEAQQPAQGFNLFGALRSIGSQAVIAGGRSLTIAGGAARHIAGDAPVVGLAAQTVQAFGNQIVEGGGALVPGVLEAPPAPDAKCCLWIDIDGTLNENVAKDQNPLGPSFAQLCGISEVNSKCHARILSFRALWYPEAPACCHGRLGSTVGTGTFFTSIRAFAKDGIAKRDWAKAHPRPRFFSDTAGWLKWGRLFRGFSNVQWESKVWEMLRHPECNEHWIIDDNVAIERQSEHRFADGTRVLINRVPPEEWRKAVENCCGTPKQR